MTRIDAKDGTRPPAATPRINRIGRRRLLGGMSAAGFAVLFSAACRDGAADTSASTAPASETNLLDAADTGTAVVSGTEAAITSMPVGTNPFDDYTYENAATGTQVRIWVADRLRHIEANGLPDHETGTFPNANNPNAISAQSYSFQVPAEPELTGASTPNGILGIFGIAINGVPFDPGAAEFWNNDPTSGWQWEALSAGINLGEDESNAHVQPTGGYHYHGMPEGILAGQTEAEHSPLVGFAADGFPIYARTGYAVADNPSEGVIALSSSWRLKSGTRPDGPGGTYDGSYVADYEVVPGSGDLDENNGRFGITPEYPGGTYYYVVTDDFPFIPRSFAGTPDHGFARGTGGGAARPRGGPAPR